MDCAAVLGKGKYSPDSTNTIFPRSRPLWFFPVWLTSSTINNVDTKIRVVGLVSTEGISTFTSGPCEWQRDTTLLQEFLIFPLRIVVLRFLIGWKSSSKLSCQHGNTKSNCNLLHSSLPLVQPLEPTWITFTGYTNLTVRVTTDSSSYPLVISISGSWTEENRSSLIKWNTVQCHKSLILENTKLH